MGERETAAGGDTTDDATDASGTAADVSGTAAETSATVTDESASAADAYSTVFGAFPYAAFASRSYLFKLYVLVGGLFALFGSVVFLFALVGLLGSLSGTPSGVLTFQPALYLLVWLFAVGPIVAPILSVARRHRLGTDDRSYDFLLAATGFAFVASLYLAAVISTPEAQQETVRPGPFAPLVRFLYDLPQLAGLAPPLVAGLLVLAAHYLRR